MPCYLVMGLQRAREDCEEGYMNFKIRVRVRNQIGRIWTWIGREIDNMHNRYTSSQLCPIASRS